MANSSAPRRFSVEKIDCAIILAHRPASPVAQSGGPASLAVGPDARQFLVNSGRRLADCYASRLANAADRTGAHRGVVLVPAVAASVSLLSSPVSPVAEMVAVDEVAVCAALFTRAADFRRQQSAGGMEYPYLQLALHALADRAWSGEHGLSSVTGLCVGGAGLFVVGLSHGGCHREAAFARCDVGQPAWLRQRFSGPCDASDRDARETENHLGMVVVFDALYLAARAAQLRLRHRAASSYSDQPDSEARSAVPAGFAWIDSAVAAVRRADCDGGSFVVVQVSTPFGSDHRSGFGRRGHRRLAGRPLAAPALPGAGDRSQVLPAELRLAANRRRVGGFAAHDDRDSASARIGGEDTPIGAANRERNDLSAR